MSSVELRGECADPDVNPARSLTSARLAQVFDLRRLVILREVASGGSFAAAASTLQFTPSAISQQMAALERDTGAVLFERTHAGMRLSPVGETLLAHSEGLLSRMANADDELQALIEGRSGRLRFGSFPTGTTAFAAAALDALRRRLPEVVLHFVEGEPFETVARLRARELDLGVLFRFDGWSPANDYEGRALGGDAGLEYVHLFDDPYRLVMPPEHPLAGSGVLELDALAGVPIVGSAGACSPWGAALRRACVDRGFEPAFEPFFRTADFSSVQALVATGGPLALMPSSALDPLRDDLLARPLEQAPVRRVEVAMPAEAGASFCRDEMVRELLDATAPRRKPQAPHLVLS